MIAYETYQIHQFGSGIPAALLVEIDVGIYDVPHIQDDCFIKLSIRCIWIRECGCPGQDCRAEYSLPFGDVRRARGGEGQVINYGLVLLGSRAIGIPENRAWGDFRASLHL